jgi:general stress protein YciG
MRRKNGAAVALGRKGGRSRADILTAEERSEIARKGGLAKAANRAQSSPFPGAIAREFPKNIDLLLKAAKRNGTAAALATETDLAESQGQTKKRNA